MDRCVAPNWGLALALTIACVLPLVSSAHGVRETGEQDEPAEQPVLFPELLLQWLVPMADAKAHIRVDQAGGFRYIEADGIADHATGRFPNSGNPNSIKAQNYRYRMPLEPHPAGRETPVRHDTFGVAINGVPFDAATAEYWNRDRRADWNIEALTGHMNLGLDRNNAHVQPNGAYHYHGLPIGLLDQYDYRNKPLLIGYAADGFPIYGPYGYRTSNDAASGMKPLKPGYQTKSGTRPGGRSGPGGPYDGTYSKDWEYLPGSGDLDRCNGREGVTPEYPQGTYYYVITAEYPFIPRCWVGEPDHSFKKRGGMGAGPGGDRGGPRPSGSRRGGPPQEAFDACQHRSNGASCKVDTPRGAMDGTCRTPRHGSSDELVCVPLRGMGGPGRPGGEPGRGFGPERRGGPPRRF